MNFVIVSGMSGAGKSQAASFLEDAGYYLVDNLPAQMIPPFAELCMAGTARRDRVAVVCDIRGGETFDALFDALEQLTAMSCPYQILFMEASSDTIIRRYKETRRTHPLLQPGRTLEEAVALERAALESVKKRSQYCIDTSSTSTAKLRGEVLRLFAPAEKQSALAVTVTSFGFKYGLPMEADLVFDVRFLPNPFYISSLRPLTGLEEEVQSFLFGYRQTLDFLSKIEDLLTFLLPQYQEEGKSALVIAVGCTGGRHRSVALAHALAQGMEQKGYCVHESHRDIGRA